MKLRKKGGWRSRWSPSLPCTSGLTVTLAVTGSILPLCGVYLYLHRIYFFPCSNVLVSGTLGLCVPTVWSGLSCGNALVDRGGSPSRYNNYFWSTLQSGVFSKLFNTWLFRTWGLVLVDFRPASWRAATALKLAENAELVIVRGGEPGGVGAWPQDWLRSRWSQFSKKDLRLSIPGCPVNLR